MNFRLKITINLAPADLPKEGGRYDLPIAVALLAASEQLTASNLEAYELVGELALTGALRGVHGAISSATEAIRAGRNIIVATENAAEVGLISKEGCFIADHLQTVCAFLEGNTPGKTFSSGYGIAYRNCRSSRCDRSGAG